MKVFAVFKVWEFEGRELLDLYLSKERIIQTFGKPDHSNTIDPAPDDLYCDWLQIEEMEVIE